MSVEALAAQAESDLQRGDRLIVSDSRDSTGRWGQPLPPKMVGCGSQAAACAGVENRYSGRVGLTSRGASTTDVMLAGNWKTSRMVAHYSAVATAERGAVAVVFGVGYLPP